MVTEETFFGGSVTTDPMSADVTLNRGSARVQVVKPDAAGRFVFLPPATQLALGGPHFYVLNIDTTNSVGIKDDGGTVLETIVAGDGCVFYLSENSTDDGVWRIKSSTIGQGSPSNPTIPPGLYVWSGRLAAGAFSDHHKYDPVGDTWDASPTNFTDTREAPGTVVFQGNHHSMGGERVTFTASYQDTNDEYNPVTDAWTANSDWASPLDDKQGPVCDVIGSDILIMGGQGDTIGTPSNREMIEWTPDTYVQRADPGVSNGKQEHIGGVLNSKFYVNSSLSGTSQLNEFWVFDSWTTDTAFPGPLKLVNRGWSISGTILYAFGGRNTATGFAVTDTDEFDESSSTWSNLTSIPSPSRMEPCTGALQVSSGDSYLVHGNSGTTGSQIPLNDVDKYDRGADTWSSVMNHPLNRLFSGGVGR